MCRWKWASVVALFVPCLAFAAGWERVAASELLGAPVLGRDGTALGKLRDLVLDVRNELQPAPQGVILRADPQALLDGARIRAPAERELPIGSPLLQYVRASQIVGRSIDDRTGTHAGEIEEAVLDLERGLVLYLLFDYDEAWGLDQPALRMAAQQFAFPAAGGPAVVNVARERLEQPGS